MIGLPRLLKMQRLTILTQKLLKKQEKATKKKNHKFAEECDNWSDAVFLDKARLTLSGKITKTTLLLVGKKESAYKLDHIAQIVWECHQDGTRFGDIFNASFYSQYNRTARKNTQLPIQDLSKKFSHSSRSLEV